MPTHSPLNRLSDFDLASHVLNVCRIQSLGAAFVAHKLLHSGGSRLSEKGVGGGGGGGQLSADPEIGGRPSPKNYFRSFGPHFGRKIRGGGARPPSPSPGSAPAAMHALKLYCFLNVCTAATVFILCVLYWVFDVVSMIYLQKC